MKLLTFAHRKEAESFIDYLNFKPVNFHFDGLFRNDNDFLLITGEGTQNATEKVVATISFFKNEIKHLYNIGIAGSLSNKASKGELVEIRTSYAHHATRLEFKSFTSNATDSNLDCMTVFERVLSLDQRKKLSLHADIIDRELWSIASASHLFKIPFTAYKYISDDLNDENFCQLIIRESEIISFKLLNFYNLKTKSNLGSISQATAESLIKNHSSLYFTVTQNRNLLHLLSLLKNTQFNESTFLEREDIKSILNSETLPKDKSKKVLELLLLEINPVHGKIKQLFNSSIRPLTNSDIEVKHDKDFEDKTLTLSFKINSTESLNSKIRALTNFDYRKIDDLFNGNFDV